MIAQCKSPYSKRWHKLESFNHRFHCIGKNKIQYKDIPIINWEQRNDRIE